MSEQHEWSGLCPKCGGELRVPGTLDEFSCMFCGARLSADELLDTPAVKTTSTSLDDIAAVLERCSAQEAKVIADIVKAAKISIEKYL